MFNELVKDGEYVNQTEGGEHMGVGNKDEKDEEKDKDVNEKNTKVEKQSSFLPLLEEWTWGEVGAHLHVIGCWYLFNSYKHMIYTLVNY